jgi:hypothetical protein
MLGQKMADLPQERISECSPFDFSGVDYFGPFIVKNGRKEMKRWGVLFTCLSSRAVHLDIAYDLTTSSFLNVFRRFIAVRGPVKVLFCDNGTNFVGACKILDNRDIRKGLLDFQCELEMRFNPPSASHMGGAWERMIKSVRSILSIMLAKHGSMVNDDSLQTLFSEIMSILNNRPLSVDFLDDPSSSEPLTPNHILTLKSKVWVPPPQSFCDANIYSVNRWKRVQYLTNEFWTRWKREYLNCLQTRSKWQCKKKNLKEGDIVVVNDDNIPRNCWKLAKVVEVFPSKDNIVRSVKVLVDGKFFTRPVNKLVLILES